MNKKELEICSNDIIVRISRALGMDYDHNSQSRNFLISSYLDALKNYLLTIKYYRINENKEHSKMSLRQLPSLEKCETVLNLIECWNCKKILEIEKLLKKHESDIVLHSHFMDISQNKLIELETLVRKIEFKTVKKKISPFKITKTYKEPIHKSKIESNLALNFITPVKKIKTVYNHSSEKQRNVKSEINEEYIIGKSLVCPKTPLAELLSPLNLWNNNTQNNMINLSPQCNTVEPTSLLTEPLIFFHK